MVSDPLNIEPLVKPQTGLVYLRNEITFLRERREKRLVYYYNKYTSQIDLDAFLMNEVPERVVSEMVKQEAFTYESIESMIDAKQPSITRIIRWLQLRGFVKLWGKRYNPGAPHTKIWLIDGGDQEKAAMLKRRNP